MKLPFIKKSKWPRIAPPMEEKSYGLSSDEKLEDYIIDELMDAVKNRNVADFRRALEAFVLSMFDQSEDDQDAS